MRKVIAIIISIISISLLAHTNVSASYMPTNPIDKDVDGQPAGEEYKDKFEFVLIDPEGNPVGPTIKNNTPANPDSDGNPTYFYGEFFLIDEVNTYLNNHQLDPAQSYVTFTLEEVQTNVPNMKFDPKIYNINVYYTVVSNQFSVQNSFQYFEIDGEFYNIVGERLVKLPNETFTTDYGNFLRFKFNNKTIHFVNHTVNKLWENGSESSVEVQLLQDGTPYGAPVELNDTNAWTYTWQQLDDSYTWSVVELNVPEGYQATTVVSADGLTTTITNTKLVTPAVEDSANPTDTTVTPNKRGESVKTADGLTTTITNTILVTPAVEDPANPTDTTVTPNKRGESVKTSDSFNALAWSLILGTSFVSILFTMYIRRKIQNEHS